jgi:deoxyadenosine/deoxycytidine kinase
LPLGSADSKSGKQSHVIALEGLIGIGKSTLCNKLIENFPSDVDVYKEQTNEKFLQLFYSDTKRYGFALQWGMLKSRIYQLRLAQHDAQHGRVPTRKYFYWDRSMIGDYTFALWNHLLGGISKQEMEVYESEFGGSVRALDKIEFMNDIDLFVFMDDEPKRCKDRVEHLRKNPSEQGIPIDYYNGLDDIHFHIFVEMMIKNVSKVVVVTWGEYDDPVGTQNLFQSIIQGKKRSPIVGRVDISEISDPSPNSLVYETESDLMTFYGLICDQAAELTQRKSYENVYIPSNVMTISHEAKGIISDHDYDITFYQNEYKRVVMWHLANFQNVYFYNTPTL